MLGADGPGEWSMVTMSHQENCSDGS